MEVLTHAQLAQALRCPEYMLYNYIWPMEMYPNGAAERTIKKVVNIERTMLMQYALRCPEYMLYNYIWPMEMYYAVWVYSRITDMQSRLSSI